MATFNASFAAARKAGKSEFSWNGKKYNTKLASGAPKPKPRTAKPTAKPVTPKPKAKPVTASSVAAKNRAKATGAKPKPVKYRTGGGF